MTTETDQVNAEPQVEDDGPDSDFDAGFDGNEQTTTPAPAVDTAPVAQDAAPAAEVAPAPKLAQITEEQFNALMEKANQVDQIKADAKRSIDTLAGHLGGMKQVVEGLKQRGPMNAGQLKRFSAEFPEMAKLLQEDLADVGGQGAPNAPSGQAIDPAEIERRVAAIAEARVAQLEVKQEVKAIARAHPDWVEVVNKPAFVNWSRTLTPADQQRLGGTDGDFIAARISDFKAIEAAHLANQAAAQKAAAAKAATSNNRSRRLEAAVPAKGVGGHAPAPSGDDDFDAGFRTG